MKTYKITVSRVVYESQVFEVSAENVDAANRLAIAEAENMDNWNFLQCDYEAIESEIAP